MKDLVKVVEVGKATLFFPERSFPLGKKIMAVGGEAGIDGQSGFIGIQGRADTEDLSQIGNGGEGLPESDAEGEVSS